MSACIDVDDPEPVVVGSESAVIAVLANLDGRISESR